MTAINFNNKSLIFPQIVSEKGRSSSRQLINTSTSGECVSSEVKLTETIQNKTEMERVTAFEAKARQSMLKLTTPGPKGMHLLDDARREDLATLTRDMRLEAATLNSELTVCHVEVDCLVIPVDLTLDAHTADRMRQHVQIMLMDLRNFIMNPDTSLSPAQRYSKARTQYYACQNLVAWVSGMNSDTVRFAIEEAGEKCIDVKSVPPSSMPCLDNAITLFEPIDETTAPTFAELPA